MMDSDRSGRDVVSAPSPRRARIGRVAGGVAVALTAIGTATLVTTARLPPTGRGDGPSLSPIPALIHTDGAPAGNLARYHGLSGALAFDMTVDDVNSNVSADPASALAVPDGVRSSWSHDELNVDFAFSVNQPGTYFAYAELWGGARGEHPIAFARRRLQNLVAGRQAVSLGFSGEIIGKAIARLSRNDSRAVSTRFLLRHLVVEQVDGHPPRQVARLARFVLESTAAVAKFQ